MIAGLSNLHYTTLHLLLSWLGNGIMLIFAGGQAGWCKQETGNKLVEVDWWRHKDKRTSTPLTLREGHTEMPLVLIYLSPQLLLQLSVYYVLYNATKLWVSLLKEASMSWCLSRLHALVLNSAQHSEKVCLFPVLQCWCLWDESSCQGPGRATAKQSQNSSSSSAPIQWQTHNAG
jgi:hypothetical protein